MASLALTRSRTFRLTPFVLPALPLNWSIPTLHSLLDLLPPFLLAVPKKKVSHSRKAMRSANKGLKDKHNIVNCPACGVPKLAHHLCRQCYHTMTRERRLNVRLDAENAKTEKTPSSPDNSLPSWWTRMFRNEK